ncbi:hypothetical protein J4Q44_G00311620 [Coregonus suidteri]|uniref:Uncharacterized protein n=1 Tax=Coregonus suidteri TaxID=861788 RepID=A0AAN8KV85_9TELE
MSWTMEINCLQDLIKAEEEEESLLDSYSNPAKASQKRAPNTPEHPKCSATPSQRGGRWCLRSGLSRAHVGQGGKGSRTGFSWSSWRDQRTL